MPRFHKERKNIFNARRELSLREPKGCYVSHSQFADEAVRPSPEPDRAAPCRGSTAPLASQVRLKVFGRPKGN